MSPFPWGNAPSGANLSYQYEKMEFGIGKIWPQLVIKNHYELETGLHCLCPLALCTMSLCD